MSVHLEAATREIERLNKIARQFEEERNELRDALIEALDELSNSPATYEYIIRVCERALANTEKETRR